MLGCETISPERIFFILVPKYEIRPPSLSSASLAIPTKLPLFLIGDWGYY